VDRVFPEFPVEIIRVFPRQIPAFPAVKRDREFPAAFIIPVCPRRTQAFLEDKLFPEFRVV
jgi:hypothetical protein